MHKIYSNKNDSIFIEMDSLEKYIKNYIYNSPYKLNDIKIDFFLNKKKEKNEIFIFIKDNLNVDTLVKIDALRRDVLFFLKLELNIIDFYVNIVLR